MPQPAQQHDVEGRNRVAWSSPTGLRLYQSRSGWSDPGEQAAFELVADECRGRPILDIGVGGGRTVPLLTAISADYRAIDFMPSMVEICRSNQPQADVSLGDARDMPQFADGAFALVVFSWNGIDAVDHDDRLKILAEIHRVLEPGGYFILATHNLRGKGFEEKPWKIHPSDLIHPRHIARRTLGFPRNLRNHRRNRALEATGDGWAIRNAAGHNFELMVHYTTLENQVSELHSLGFTDVAAIECDNGKAIEADTQHPHPWWLHFESREGHPTGPDDGAPMTEPR